MDPQCHQCQQKEDLINKYLKLIKLLKTKCDKSAKSFLKNNTLPSDTLHQTSHENSQSISSNLHSKVIESDLCPQKTALEQIKTCQLKLGLIIISHKASKSLLKQSFEDLKEFSTHKKQVNTPKLHKQKTTFQCSSIQSLIQETLSNGKFFHKKPQISQTKLLHSEILSLQIKNDEMSKKMTKLQKELSESEKRFMKEMEKKRDSLQTFGQEIREKTENIAELQYTIKQYETELGKKLNKPVGNVLDEDLDELKTNCQRLQSVNEKLNNTVKALEETVTLLSEQLVSLKLSNSQTKEQNKTLKQKVFDLSYQLGQKQQISSAYKNLLKKLNQKLLSIKLKEKHIIQILKASSSNSNSVKPQFLTQSCEPIKIINQKLVSTKNTDLSVDVNPLQNENNYSQKNLKELEAEQKIEEIFAFLFNIREGNYRIENEDIFDDDQKQLLKSHKQIFLNQAKDQSFGSVKRDSLKQNIKIDQSEFIRQDDQVFYLNNNYKNSNRNIQQDSVLCVFEPINQMKCEQNNEVGNKMRLIQLEIEKSRLIEKISELKNLQMHIRNVILNLMKSIDLSVCKPETSSILQVVFDFFEYSQEQKSEIFKDKKKKFWGFL